ncbi:MAG: tRNA uridine-5-carboxymethylaminomethyl(34) synthesis GTPase MnmE [Bacteroidales bacterium]|nr:tRNA uridine-5-carboxymethylaminomethyl(34) synthesis GTPase MnmE [Bacteroidales bacterium]
MNIFFDPDKTIVALASGTGGAISVIRISGENAIEIVDALFKTRVKAKDLKAYKGFSLIYGEIRDKDVIVDDVLISIFRAPNSYTGEDSVEISCHASPYIQQKILELLVGMGAYPARPGEFTRRAFMNGRMDLSQAEAVADVIASETESAHRLAIDQMRGGYSEEINKLRDRMLHFASMIELELDFGDEDVEFADRSELKSMVEEIKGYTDSLTDSFSYGNVIKNGVPVAIVGKPNVGKSTLLNALLKDDKAIVSEIPGTTRDAIEDTIIIEGILFRFIDTAGLRETADVIENLGIRKTYQKIDQSNIVLLLTEADDGSESISQSVNEIQKQIEGTHKSLLVVVNKTDLLDKESLNKLKSRLNGNKSQYVYLSAKKGLGIPELISCLTGLINGSRSDSHSLIITNLRHYDALRHCSENLERVLESIDNNIPEDLIAMDLRQAIHYLGEITGEISTDEILGNIFSNFCIGK